MLKHFRELLMKRATPELRDIIAKSADSALGELILEVLQKARATGAVNHAVSAAIAHALPAAEDAHPLEGLDAAMTHDALGHHLSHYKAALNAGNRELANDHLSAAMRTIRHATTLERESGGKILRIRSGVTAPKEGEEGTHLLSPKPWEMVYSGSKRRDEKPSEYAETPKLWARERSKRGMFSDHNYMESAPNPNHEESKKAHDLHGYHESAYPFHEIQINGHYVTIDDGLQSPGEFKPHALDSHPAVKHAYTDTKDWAKNADAYNSALETEHKAWLKSPEVDAWINQQIEKDSDPTHMMRGLDKSKPIHEKPATHDLDPVFGKLSGKRGPKSAETAPAPAPATAPKYADPSLKPIPSGADEQVVAAQVHSLINTGMAADKVAGLLRIPKEEVARLHDQHKDRLSGMAEAAHKLIAEGHQPKDIAKMLNISTSSVADFAKQYQAKQLLRDIEAKKVK